MKFLKLHYCLSKRDEPFWRDNADPASIPGVVLRARSAQEAWAALDVRARVKTDVPPEPPEAPWPDLETAFAERFGVELRIVSAATRWQLDEPAASYLVTLAVGPYRHHRQEGPHGLPLSYWVPRDRPALLKPLKTTPAAVRWLERRLGRYPYRQFGIVVTPWKLVGLIGAFMFALLIGIPLGLLAGRQRKLARAKFDRQQARAQLAETLPAPLIPLLAVLLLITFVPDTVLWLPRTLKELGYL